MQNVVTVTLNPAFDVHFELERFELGKENYSSKRIVHAGGKGLNISRALRMNGIDSLAFIVLGEDDAAEFQVQLDAENLNYRAFLCPGSVRHNITIHPAEGPETRLSLDTFHMDRSLFQEITDQLLPLIHPGVVAAYGGRLPKGLPLEAVKELFTALKERGALLVLDCNNLSLQDLAEIKPWLIKPNEYEAEALLGRKISTDDEVLRSAEEIHGLGVENVLISLGERGLAYAGREMGGWARVPQITPASTIGAGDSTLAGFIFAHLQGGDGAEKLKTAAAFGTAACLTPGTQPPKPEAIVQITAQVKVDILNFC